MVPPIKPSVLTIGHLFAVTSLWDRSNHLILPGWTTTWWISHIRPWRDPERRKIDASLKQQHEVGDLRLPSQLARPSPRCATKVTATGLKVLWSRRTAYCLPACPSSASWLVSQELSTHGYTQYIYINKHAHAYKLVECKARPCSKLTYTVFPNENDRRMMNFIELQCQLTRMVKKIQ